MVELLHKTNQHTQWLEILVVMFGMNMQLSTKIFFGLFKILALSGFKLIKTSIDVLPSKNQALCKYCTHVSNY